jgi:hypothetical protein
MASLLIVVAPSLPKPYMWGYEFAHVAGFDEAHAKGVRVDKARCGGWYVDWIMPQGRCIVHHWGDASLI